MRYQTGTGDAVDPNLQTKILSMNNFNIWGFELRVKIVLKIDEDRSSWSVLILKYSAQMIFYALQLLLQIRKAHPVSYLRILEKEEGCGEKLH